MAEYISTLTGAEMDTALTDMNNHVSEAWAVGKRNGMDVPSSDETYHNNAKYFAEQAVESSSHPPIIGQNGNWWIWDVNEGEYVDSTYDASITVQVGTVVDGNTVSVTNSGTNTDVILDFVLRRGADGTSVDRISKTSTSGNVDTYTMYDSNNVAIGTFTVTNGTGIGDMVAATYDPLGAVANSGGIPAYVDTNGGKIDHIQVNSTEQTITNKTVNISVPTNNNQLTNGAGYQTASQVSTAVNSLLPSQSGQSGKYLKTNGSALSWDNAGGGAVDFTASVTTTWTADSNAGWYYQDINVTGILATDTPLVDVDLSSATNSEDVEAILTDYCNIFRVTTSAGSIRVYSSQESTTAFTLRLKAVR